MSHIQYTLCRSGRYYYNRRVPKHAVQAYGSFIRLALSKDPLRLQLMQNVWVMYWRELGVILQDYSQLMWLVSLSSFKPRSSLLSEMAEEYLLLRQIDQTPPRVALTTFISIAGDRLVSEYTREDAKLFVDHLAIKGNKTATIRRRINSLSAIMNYAYSELDLDKRNPFTRLFIRNEGHDVFKRGTFTKEQLKLGYDKALASGSTSNSSCLS